MTPKSLLRHPLAASRRPIWRGDFQPVIDDARAAAGPAAVRRVVLCSGKVCGLIWRGTSERAADESLAVVRVEELYPFPAAEIRRSCVPTPNVDEVTWLQEEPQNMGAWHFVANELRGRLPSGLNLRYIGRPEMASPSEGWSDAHAAEQRRIVGAVLEGVLERGVSHAG